MNTPDIIFRGPDEMKISVDVVLCTDVNLFKGADNKRIMGLDYFIITFDKSADKFWWKWCKVDEKITKQELKQLVDERKVYLGKSYIESVKKHG